MPPLLAIEGEPLACTQVPSRCIPICVAGNDCRELTRGQARIFLLRPVPGTLTMLVYPSQWYMPAGHCFWAHQPGSLGTQQQHS